MVSEIQVLAYRQLGSPYACIPLPNRSIRALREPSKRAKKKAALSGLSIMQVTEGHRTPDPMLPEALTPDPMLPDDLTPDPMLPEALTPDPMLPDDLMPDPMLPSVETEAVLVSAEPTLLWLISASVAAPALANAPSESTIESCKLLKDKDFFTQLSSSNPNNLNLRRADQRYEICSRHM